MGSDAGTSGANGALERAFAPRWAGGWAISRILFALAVLDLQVGRFPSVRNALAAPSLVLSSGPARVADQVLLGGGAAWSLWVAGILGVGALLFGGRLAKPGLLLWFASHTVLLVSLGLNVRAPERLIVFVVFALLLGPIGERALSQKARSPVGRWFLMLVFGALYGSTGAMKLLEEPAWWTGDALPYDLVDRHHAGGAFAAWLSGQPALCFLLGWGTILFEAGFPFLIGFVAVAPYLLLAGVGMHVTVGMLMDVGPLGTVAMAMYPVLLDPDVGQRVWARIAAIAARRPGRL